MGSNTDTFTLPTNIFFVGILEDSHCAKVESQAAFIATRVVKPLQTIAICGSLFKNLHFVIESIFTIFQGISQERRFHDLSEGIRQLST